MPRVTFPPAGLHIAEIEFSPSICSKTFLCMSFGRCSCGALPIHPGALYFNQYHIKFNTCFEMCTRSKALPGDGGWGCLLQKHIPSQPLLHKQLSFTFGWTRRTVNTSTLPTRREVMGSKQERRLNALGSAWLFVNPAGCMEEAFSTVTRTQKSTL